MLHGRFALFNPANLRLRWATMQQARQTVELRLRPDGVHLHSSVILIADPSTHADRIRAVLDKPAESDALHAS